MTSKKEVSTPSLSDSMDSVADVLGMSLSWKGGKVSGTTTRPLGYGPLAGEFSITCRVVDSITDRMSGTAIVVVQLSSALYLAVYSQFHMKALHVFVLDGSRLKFRAAIDSGKPAMNYKFSRGVVSRRGFIDAIMDGVVALFVANGTEWLQVPDPVSLLKTYSQSFSRDGGFESLIAKALGTQAA